MILKTKRLVIRHHILDDSLILHEKLGLNPKIYEYSGWNPYETIEKSQKTVTEFINNYSKKHFYAWAIEKDGNLIGTIGAYDYNLNDESIEIGFSICEEYWGFGFASEALDRIINFLISVDDIKSIRAWCVSENIASRKVLEKCHMKNTGIIENDIEINGKSYDRLNFEYKK